MLFLGEGIDFLGEGTDFLGVGMEFLGAGIDLPTICNSTVKARSCDQSE